MYEIGIPLLLRHTTYLPEMEENRLLRHFLLSNPSRFIHVIRLTCVYSDLHYHWKDAPPSLLPDFIRLSTRLQFLDLRVTSSKPEYPVKLKAEDIAPIALLPDLKHLKISGPISVSNLLHALTAPIKSLEIHRHEPGYAHPDAPILYDPLSSIAHLSGSLESFSFVTNGPADSNSIFTPGHHFPSMRKLEWVSWSPINMGVLASTFPNLESLTVDFNSTSLRRPRALSFAQMQVFRQQNHTNDTLHYLCHLKGSILSLWVLGIRCHVELLEFPTKICWSWGIPASIAEELLAAIRPSRLRLSSSSGDNAVIKTTESIEKMEGRLIVFETVEELELSFVVADHEVARTAKYLVRFLARGIRFISNPLYRKASSSKEIGSH